MKIELEDKNGVLFSAYIENDKAHLILNDGQSELSFLADLDNLDFLVDNLKKMRLKIRQDLNDCN